MFGLGLQGDVPICPRPQCSEKSERVFLSTEGPEEVLGVVGRTRSREGKRGVLKREV